MKKIIPLLLSPFSLIYGTLLHIRNKFYDWNIFKSFSFNIPIISVGNLTLGGTGKTPHVEYLIRLLKKDYEISTLSRGYKRKTKGFLISSEDSTVNCIGDEPLQYKLKFNQIKVAVDEKRVRGIRKLKKIYPKTNLILLDDAFQHRSVKPRVNILITEFNNLYINDSMFPSGRLREWKTGSNRANIIIVSKTDPNLSEITKNQIKNKLNPKSYQKIYFSSVKYGEITPFTMQAKAITQNISNDYSALLLTGIAKPKPFFEALSKQYKLVKHIKFSDHHNFKDSDIENIIKEFNTLKETTKFIISTEKDIMRLSLPQILNKLQDIPIFYIPIEIDFLGKDKNDFDNQIIKYVTKNTGN